MSSPRTTTIAITAPKGGVGKSSLTTNLAAALAARGQRVLVVDADPQASATKGLGLTAVTTGGFETLLLGGSEPGAVTAIPSRVANVDVICGSGAGTDLATRVSIEKVPITRLGRRLDMFHAESGASYDITLVDTPGTQDGVLVDLAVCAATAVIGVFEPETWSVEALASLKRRLAELTDEGLGAPLAGVIANRHTERNGLHRDWMEVIRRHENLLGTVRRSGRIPASQTSGGKVIRPMVARSPGHTASADIFAIADRILGFAGQGGLS